MNNDRSFLIKILEGSVSVEPLVLSTIFRKQILNYEGAPLKDVQVSIVEMDIDGKKVPLLKTTGKMKLVIWSPFEMISTLGVDKATNCMMINAVKISAFGFPVAKIFMDISPIKLEHLISIKPGKGLTFKKNTMYIDTLNIMPPPKQIGKVLDIQINAKTNTLDLKLGEEKPPVIKYTLLDPKAKNYIYIFNGNLIFGKMLSSNGRMQLVDANPSDYLDFYLAKYLLQISRSKVQMTPDAAQIVTMVDYQTIISPPPPPQPAAKKPEAKKPAAEVKPTAKAAPKPATEKPAVAKTEPAKPKPAPAKAAVTKAETDKPKPAPAKPAVAKAKIAKPKPAPAKPAAPAPAVKESGPINLHLEFDTAKSDIKEKYHNNIKKVADLLQKSPDTKVVIDGYTDNVDKFNNPDNNVKLSQARADSVRQYLIDKFGIDASRITAVGYGPNKPIADNKTEEGRKKNRRIEAVIEKMTTTPPQGDVAPPIKE
jgi:OOP family OmpA-OmpF porin